MTYRYVIGMDVGKYFHHACVLDEHGTQVEASWVWFRFFYGPVLMGWVR